MYYIYQLTFENGQTYIGSTNNIHKRLLKHKSNCNKERYRHLPIYQCMRECPDFDCEVIFEENCTKIVARQLEQQCINIYKPTLNDIRAFRTEEERKQQVKEYLQQNKEQILLKRKEWAQQNKEHIALYKKKFYQQNKEEIEKKKATKIKCECGSIVRKSDLSKHKRTKKHVKFMSIK